MIKAVDILKFISINEMAELIIIKYLFRYSFTVYVF